MYEKSLGGAVLLVFFAAVAGAIAPRPTHPIGKKEHHQGAQQPDTSQGVAVVAHGLYSLDEQACKQKTQDATYADLCQQWRMAEAAERQVFWTVFEAIGLIVVLVFTAWAAIAAQRSASAAQASVSQAEDALRADRAWISLEKIQLKAAKNGSFWAVIHWCNTGRSPATDVLLRTDTAIVAPGQTKMFLGEEGTMNFGALGPGITQGVNTKAFPPDATRRARDGGVRLVVHGTAVYADIYGAARHITEATFEFLVPTEATDAEVVDPGWITKALTMRAWPTQNTAT